MTNETDLSGGETNVVSLSVGAGSARCATPSIGRATDEGGRQAAQNSHLYLEDGKGSADSTLAEQKWAKPEWTLRDEVGESYREIP